MALFEMTGQDNKAQEQRQKVGESNPLVLQMRGKTRQSRSGWETGKQEFVDNDDGDTGHGDIETVVMEEGDADQDECKQNEVNRDSGYGW